MKTGKTQIFEQLAEIARVLGHANRLELIEHISQGERSVERLAGLIGQTVANTSAHLQHLRRGGFVETRRDGKHVLYSLGSGPVIELIGALQVFAERSRAEVRELVSDCFSQLDSLEPVSREKLMDRLKSGDVTLLDVRPHDEYALGHLPGALNIPVDELERRIAELPRDQEIVAYCRGHYCVLSFEVVAALRKRGYSIRRLEDGFPEWKAAGFRVEASPSGAVEA